ncbi:calcium-binding protein [Neogemmobacter tilapiae]|uniref:Calcium-binding protein n=1 Tax=Neogemmobacter tilapiae TaxID=875041 RepID=A0A918TH80_9RHOB|nr:calcium-binding protein [Gemmobacter tilapiae]GHC48040.1 hypothetical protein GCM10007315_07450 [Gemmobacter tilapiae]
MTDNVYDAVSGSHAGETLDDDGSGQDWLTISGSYNPLEYSVLTLQFTVDGSFVATSARATIWDSPNLSRTLTVTGLIENARGSDSRDYITGNTGANILYGDNAASGLGGNDTIFGDEGSDTIYGGAGNDEANGAEDADLIFGNDGNDNLSGAGGNDTIEGGAGADTMSGSSDAGDVLSYRTSNAGVTIRFEWGSTIFGMGGHAQGDRINGFEDIEGSDFADTLSEDTQAGLQVANVFRGYSGNDRMSLGGGNDTGMGGVGNDQINGEDGNDRLIGGAGLDQLKGGKGADQLVGEAGADRFIFALASDSTVSVAGRDTITDFNRGQGDKINLAGMDAQSGAGNQAFDFIGTARFTGDKGDLRYVRAGTDVIVQGDINGDKKADFAILVEDIGNLRAGDFIL